MFILYTGSSRGYSLIYHFSFVLLSMKSIGWSSQSFDNDFNSTANILFSVSSANCNPFSQCSNISFIVGSIIIFSSSSLCFSLVFVITNSIGCSKSSNKVLNFFANNFKHSFTINLHNFATSLNQPTKRPYIKLLAVKEVLKLSNIGDKEKLKK